MPNLHFSLNANLSEVNRFIKKLIDIRSAFKFFLELLSKLIRDSIENCALHYYVWTGHDSRVSNAIAVSTGWTLVKYNRHNPQ